MRKHFSPSWFIDYKSCPKAFYYKHIAGIKLPERKIHLIFGEAFHSSAEILLSREWEKENPVEIAQLEFERKFNPETIALEEREDYERLFPIGLAMIEKFNTEIPLLDLKYSILKGKSEEWIEAILQDPFSKELLPLNTKGKIDRLTDDENIIELKTSSGKWDERETKFKWQTQFYGWMFYQNKGRHSKKIVYVIVTKQKNPQIQILEVNYILEDYSKLFQDCKNIINKIELGIFERPEDWHPNYCDCFKYEEALNS